MIIIDAGMCYFDIKQLKFRTSWSFTDADFKEPLDSLLRKYGKFSDDGTFPVLWSTRSKYVLLLTLENGFQVVYKAPRKLRSPLRYMFRPGPWGQEAVNYQILSNLGLPMVKLISAGETRSCFILKYGYLMTEYASGFSDGREFTGEGSLCSNKTLRDEFIRRNFQYLAKMHKAGFIHKGFTPANLLFRKLQQPDANGNNLELKWIDVASCKKLFFKFNSLKHIARDLSLFFHFFDFSTEEKLSYLYSYCQERNDCSLPPEKLLRLIAAHPVR